MNAVSTQMVEMMSAKIIDAIDGYPADATEKNEIAAAIAGRIVNVDYYSGEES